MTDKTRTIGAQQMTIEPTDTGIRIGLQVAYATGQSREDVSLTVLLPPTNQPLLEIQEQAIERAKAILDLLLATGRQSTGSSESPGEEILEVWKKLAQ